MKPPDVIAGYSILRRLGEGGMGTVWAAQDPQIARVVALKTLRADRTEPEDMQRFLREADAMARVKHPGVIKIHRFGEYEGGAFLAMELIEGEPLQERIKRQGPLDPQPAARLVRDLADAVAAVHAVGILHRDLKPDNVMLRADGSPVLLDFGLARDVDRDSLTQTGTVLGSPQYMSPEQANGAKVVQLDSATDVYGLGGLLYFALTGHPPHAGKTMGALYSKLLLGLITPPRKHRPDLPAALEAVCLKALALEPEDRHPGAAALRDELARFVDGRLPSTAPPGDRLKLLLMGFVLLLLLAAGALAAGLRKAPPPAVPPPPTTELAVSPSRPLEPPPEDPDEIRQLVKTLRRQGPSPAKLQAYWELRSRRPTHPVLAELAGTVLAGKTGLTPAGGPDPKRGRMPVRFAGRRLILIDGTDPTAWNLNEPGGGLEGLQGRKNLRPLHLEAALHEDVWTLYMAGLRTRGDGAILWADAARGRGVLERQFVVTKLRPLETWLRKHIDVLAPSPDGRRLAVAMGAEVVVFSVPDFAREKVHQPHPAPVTEMAWSRDGKTLAWASGNPKAPNSENELHAWRPQDDTRLQPEGFDRPVGGLSFSSGGRLVVAVGRSLYLHDLRVSEPLNPGDIVASAQAIGHLATFGRHGLVAATHARADTGPRQLQVWDLEGRSRLLSLNLTTLGYKGGVRSLDASSELGLAAVGMGDGSVVVIALPDL